LRTTFIVGHPGETEESFGRLCDFVREAELDRVGVFNFSREEGTVAALLPGRVPQKQIDARRRELLWSAVDRVACPTLVVRGAQSDVFHDEDAERLAGRFQQGRWVRIEGAGHTVQGDNPAGLLVSLREFLAEAATGGSPSGRG